CALAMIGVAVVDSIGQHNRGAVFPNCLDDTELMFLVVAEKTVAESQVFPDGKPLDTGRFRGFCSPGLGCSPCTQFTLSKVDNTHLITFCDMTCDRPRAP